MSGGQGREKDGDTGVFFLLLGLAALALLIYGYIALWEERFGVWAFLRLAQAHAYGLILPDAYWHFFELPNAEGIIEVLRRADVLEAWGREGAAAFQARVDRAMLPPLALLSGLPFVVLGVRRWHVAAAVGERFSSPGGYLASQARLHPHLEGLAEAEPQRGDPKYRRGVRNAYAKCVNPIDFATMRPPLGLEEDRPIWDGSHFDAELAERCFAAQCGPLYEGIDGMGECARMAFDLFLPRQVLATERMAPEIKALLAGAPAGGPEETDARRSLREALPKGASDIPVRELLKRDDLGAALRLREAEIIMEAHAYTLTGLMSLLHEARMGGVLVLHSLRHHLKLHDRTMWYALSSVGRRVAFCEGAGAFAHWLVERSIGAHVPARLTEPCVEQAVRALQEHVVGVEAA